MGRGFHYSPRSKKPRPAEFSTRELAVQAARMQAVRFLNSKDISGGLVGYRFIESPRDLDLHVTRGGYLVRVISPQEYTAVNEKLPDLNKFDVNTSALLSVIRWLQKRDRVTT